MEYDVIYDGFSFLDNGCVITNDDHMRHASYDNQIERRANRPGGVLVESSYGTKPITIEGYYDGDDIVDAQNMYDTLSQAVNRQERLLVVPHAGGTRSFTATPENVVIKEPNGLNRLEFSIEFVVPEGSSTSDADTTLIASTVITTATSTIPISVLGSVVARPKFTLTFTSVSGGTAGTVSLRNARDFIGVSITHDWVTGDILTVDSDNFEIFINGVKTEPTGRFPTFQNGTGSVYYSDTFTTRSVTLSATYKARYK